ncbi:MAG TPA: HAMP domain-containing sensor histidine kinase [Coleofasciculaceae cyanobacterium]|jgi:K+-sensing histidine kinase KdpD
MQVYRALPSPSFAQIAQPTRTIYNPGSMPTAGQPIGTGGDRVCFGSIEPAEQRAQSLLLIEEALKELDAIPGNSAGAYTTEQYQSAKVKLGIANNAITELQKQMDSEIDAVMNKGQELQAKCLKEVLHDTRNLFADAAYDIEFISMAEKMPALLGQEKVKQRVDEALKRADNITQVLVNVAKNYQYWLQLMPNNKSTGEVFEHALARAKEDAQGKLRFTVNEKTDLSTINLPMHNLELGSILFHPLHNAIKYTDQGVVSVEIDKQEPTPEDQQSYCVFTVRDTGIGIDKAVLDQINDPDCEQGSRGENTEGYFGTGYGIPAVKQLLKEYDGSIQAELNSPVPGSKVTIKIPVGTSS